MSHEIINLRDQFAMTLTASVKEIEESRVIGVYHAMHFSPEGDLLWEDDFENLWTTAGKNLALDTILAGSAFTATTRMGLCGTGTKAAADTQASHAGWLEVGLANAPTYTGSRPTPAFSAAASGSKATSSNVSFSITSSGTVAGAFININGSATIDNTTGTLFSAGDFSGSRSVVNGDTITVGYTATLT